MVLQDVVGVLESIGVIEIFTSNTQQVFTHLHHQILYLGKLQNPLLNLLHIMFYFLCILLEVERDSPNFVISRRIVNVLCYKIDW